MSVEAMPEERERRSGECPKSPPAEGSRQKFLLVHGTFAASPDDEGDRWWQQGSRFSRWLAGRLGGLGLVQPELGVFHWTGANSARDRGEAAIDLARRVETLEARRQRYHLIGHSHGGLVIWEALCESVRREQDLAHLASWATVGTPFLHPAFRGFDPWSALSPSASALALAYLTPFLLDYLRHFDELVADRRFLELALLPLLWLLLAVVFAIGAVRLISQLVARERARRAARVGARAFDLYGPQWLGLWSPDDEAINGLRSSLWAGGRVIPAIAATRRGLAARVLGAATAPLRGLYNRVIAPIGDDFVWSALTRREADRGRRRAGPGAGLGGGRAGARGPRGGASRAHRGPGARGGRLRPARPHREGAVDRGEATRMAQPRHVR